MHLYQRLEPSATPQTGAHHSQKGRLSGGGVLEMGGQVSVEGDAVSLPQLVASTVAYEHERALLDQRGLPGAWLVDRGIPRCTRCASRSKLVTRKLSALAGPANRHHLEAVSLLCVSSPAAIAGPDDRDRPGLIETQELGEAQVKAGGDPSGHGQGGARLSSLDLGEHRRAHPRAFSEVAQRQSRCLAQGLHSGPNDRRVKGTPAGVLLLLGLLLPWLSPHTNVRYHGHNQGTQPQRRSSCLLTPCALPRRSRTGCRGDAQLCRCRGMCSSVSCRARRRCPAVPRPDT